MAQDDNNRPDPRDRGAYTPPTDDDLPFNRGGFDPRRAPPKKAPPVTLIISAVVLLVLIVAVIFFYRAGLRSSTDAPPAVGTPVGDMKVEAPIDAQPIDPEAGIDVYRDGAAAPTTETPTFVPPPEAVQPRPAPQPLPPVDAGSAPPPRPTAPITTPPVAKVPTPTKAPAVPVTNPSPAPAASGGSSGVQIGAFGSTTAADREYAAVAGRFPQYARGASKRVQEVTTSSGSTVYRTTFTGLSRADAQAFCAAIRSGGGDCLVR